MSKPVNLKRAKRGENHEFRYGILLLRETWVVKESTTKSMRSNRAVGTEPEEALRHALWHSGVKGYRKNVRKLPGAPDIVFARARLVVFVHGCFWHRCPKCIRDRIPKTNSLYWQTKIDGNIARDELNVAKLDAQGWRVLVVWECDVKRDVDAVAAQIKEAVGQSNPRGAPK